jgi:HEAT repeat protein
MEQALDICRLIEELGDENVSVRRTAAKNLADADERAVYPLLNALRDENPGVQDAAMRSLASIGGNVVAYMVLPLLREDSFLRNTAMLILKDIGVPSVELLYPLLTDKDDDVRKFALDLLGDIRESVEPGRVLPLLKDPNANVRAAAVRAIGILLPEGAMEKLVESLRDEEWVSFAALETLAGMKDDRAVEHISGLLDNESLALRLAAVESLGAIGSGKASDALFEFVKKSEGMEKTEAIKSLVQTGVTPSMSAVYDLLLELVQKGEWDEQKIAITGLVALKDVNAIPIIIDMAGSLDASVPDEEERIIWIKNALKEFGQTDTFAQVLNDKGTRYKGRVIAAELAGETGSVSSVQSLISGLGDDMRDVKRACAMALGRIGTPEAVEALIRAVDDHEGHVRKTAIVGLGHTGDKRAFDKLLGKLEAEEYDDILETIVKSLLAIDEERLYSLMGPFPSKVKCAVARSSSNLDILLKLSGDEDLSVVLAALSGLGSIDHKRAADRVLESTGSFDPEVRRTAVMALSGMPVDVEAVLPLLEDKDMWVRLHAVRILGQAGREDVLSRIEPLLSDCDMPVVLAALESLEAIGGREAFGLLSRAEDHPDERVRDAAARAIERM